MWWDMLGAARNMRGGGQKKFVLKKLHPRPRSKGWEQSQMLKWEHPTEDKNHLGYNPSGRVGQGAEGLTEAEFSSERLQKGKILSYS